MNRSFAQPLLAALLLSLAIVWPSLAAGGERINVDETGAAIKGYDPVAYFTMGRAVQGSAEHTHEWQDARWQFANASHRELFASDPEKYAPRYGGHCAGAMSRGVVWTIDPEAWAIVEGRLYLNFRVAGRDAFVLDPQPTIERADANWERLGAAD